MNTEFNNFVTSLKWLLDPRFNLEEIQDLCLNLSIDYEHLSGDTKPKRIENLIIYLSRSGRLIDLIALCRKERPNILWPDPPSVKEQVSYSEVLALVESSGRHRIERLQDVYIDPWPVFERVNLEFFIGRQWLIEEIDNFLERERKGYFMLVAEPGLGKTTLLAHLIKERGYIHHFVELSPGVNGIRSGLKNLAAQLIITYQLGSLLVGELLPSTAEEPHFLHSLLSAAAEKRKETEKIIVVIDALDEAGIPEQQNPLGLPKTLPEGVYIIISTRPNINLQIESTTVKRYTLQAHSSENLTDLSKFLWHATQSPSIAVLLKKHQYEAGKFVQTLSQKSQGVWIYASYVLQEIANGTRNLLDLEKLPDGLTSYYLDYWRRQRDADEALWDEAYLSILAMLAASQEPITVEKLIEWTQVNQEPRWTRRRLQEHWRPFITIVQDNSRSKYRFYHKTLQELFDGHINWENLEEVNRPIVEELIEATQEAHAKLVTRYLEAWGGLDTLSNLYIDTRIRDLDEGYGFRYIIPHLIGSNRGHDVHKLLALENAQKQNVWFIAKEQADKLGDYLDDIFSAWQLVVAEGYSIRQDIALRVRYALIHTSIVSRSDKTLPVLYGELVKMNIWSESKALRQLERVVHPVQKSRAIGWLAPYLSEYGLQTALNIAIAMLQSNAQGEYTFDAFSEAVGYLLPCLPEDFSGFHFSDLFYLSDNYASYLSNSARIVGSVSDEFREAEVWELFKELLYEVEGDYDEDVTWWWTRCLSDLARHMSLETLNQARATMQLRWSKEARQEALTILLPFLAKAGKVKNAVKLINKYFDGIERLSLISKIAHFLPVHEFESLFSEIWKIPDTYKRQQLLCENFLPHITRVGQLDRAFELVAELDSGYEILIASLSQPVAAHLIAQLLVQAPPSALVALVDKLLADNDTERALQVWQQIGSFVTDDDILKYADSPHFIWLCKYADDELIREAIGYATWAWNAYEIFGNNHLQFPQTRLQLKIEWVQGALNKSQFIGDTESQLALLSILSPHLSPDIIRYTFKLLQEIKITNWNARYIRDLTPNLPRDLQKQAEELLLPSLISNKAIARALSENKLHIKRKKSKSRYLGELGEIDNIADWLGKYSTEEQSKLLRTLPAYVHEKHLDALEEVIWQMDDEFDQGKALGNLARRYAKMGRYQRCIELVYLVQKDDLELDPDSSPTVICIKKAARYLSNEYILSATYIACLIRFEDPRQKALSILLPYLLECPNDILLAVFGSPLSLLGTYSRSHLLLALCELAPIISHLGGKEAAEDVARAVYDVCRWWP